MLLQQSFNRQWGLGESGHWGLPDHRQTFIKSLWLGLGLGRPTSRERKVKEEEGEVYIRRRMSRVTQVCGRGAFEIFLVCTFSLSFLCPFLCFSKYFGPERKVIGFVVVQCRRVTHAGAGLGENRSPASQGNQGVHPGNPNVAG